MTTKPIDHLVLWQMPRLDRDRAVVGGVAAGLAAEIGVDPVWVRLTFVALFFAGGWGAVLYLVLWVVFDVAPRWAPPPVEPRRAKASGPGPRIIGLGLIVLGLLIVLSSAPGLPPTLVVPVGLLGTASVLLYRRSQSRSPAAGGVPASTGGFWAGPWPLLIAVLAVVAALAVLAFAWDPGRGLLLVALGVVSLLAVGAPWWWRLLRDLDAERQARARSDERAEVAAHLHDSVLQTLTLIQKTDDPAIIRQLARRQERELRNWLDPDRVDRLGQSLRGMLDDLATDVESLHGVPVEVVTVGDCLVDDQVDAAVAAAREAAVNAAKHSGAEQIDIYAEVVTASDDGPERLEIFVRDTGCGFDQASVPPDRRGIAHSILSRMQRHGGEALVVSAPGEGTEIELTVPLVEHHHSHEGTLL